MEAQSLSHRLDYHLRKRRREFCQPSSLMQCSTCQSSRFSEFLNLVPPQKMKIPTLESIKKNLILADPNFSSPRLSDILLGADVLEDVMKKGKLKKNGLHIRTSISGSIVSGLVQQGNESITSNMVHIIEVDITQFWEIENVLRRNTRPSQNVDVLNVWIGQRSGPMTEDSPLRCHGNLVDLY